MASFRSTWWGVVENGTAWHAMACGSKPVLPKPLSVMPTESPRRPHSARGRSAATSPVGGGTRLQQRRTLGNLWGSAVSLEPIAPHKLQCEKSPAHKLF